MAERNKGACPPPCPFLILLIFYCRLFIEEVWLGQNQTGPLTFPYFFVFLKASNINVNSTREISDHKIYALKVECVPNTFENLNSFKMALKMLKTMQIYQKYIFLGFSLFFCYFRFF